jgi:hypothetical protein
MYIPNVILCGDRETNKMQDQTDNKEKVIKKISPVAI